MSIYAASRRLCATRIFRSPSSPSSSPSSSPWNLVTILVNILINNVAICFFTVVIILPLIVMTQASARSDIPSLGVRAVTVTSRPVLDIDPTALIAAPVDAAFDPAMCAREALRGALRARRIEDGLSALMKGGGPCPEKARVAISGMPAAHFTVASSVAAASLAVRGRRTVCAYLLEGLQPHRGGLSQATTECYTDIADESAGVRAVTVTSRPVLDIDPTAVIAAPVDAAFDPAISSSPLRPPAFPPASTALFVRAQARVAISGMPAAHFTVASSVAAASLAVRGRRTVCAYLLEGLQPHRGGLSQATTECYTDIADESA
ncbi:hypothetical protein EMIHUDRAFT_122454, partial [Emiliania huxleyi CCMP1516]|uniref:Uncharacterized protein n=2 Tax=Emiliania huxleyi TaxID=2903 RepID=A0A0D3KMV5_EMIH1